VRLVASSGGVAPHGIIRCLRTGFTSNLLTHSPATQLPAHHALPRPTTPQVSTLFLGVTLTSRAVLGVSMVTPAASTSCPAPCTPPPAPLTPRAPPHKVVASTVCFNRAAESATYSSTSELDETAYREVALVNPDEDIDLGTRESPEPRRAARGTAA
jgi:hypothetical protein